MTFAQHFIYKLNFFCIATCNTISSILTVPVTQSSNNNNNKNKQTLVSCLRSLKLDLNDEMGTNFGSLKEDGSQDDMQEQEELHEDLNKDLQEHFEIKQECLCQEAASEVSFKSSISDQFKLISYHVLVILCIYVPCY